MSITHQSKTGNTSFDVIVIGVGSMGSSACYYLSKRGYKVLGIEQFNIPHEFGSHAGQSRIIRKAYFENPHYVPLLERAYENWKELEQETGTQIYFPTGLVYFGSKGDLLIKGVKQSASLYNIKVDTLNDHETVERFPAFKIPGDFETLVEPDAGFVTPEKSIKLYSGQAIKKGAEIHKQEKVLNWEKDGSGIKVTTDKNIYRSNRLIITAGAWAGKIIPTISGRLKITRQFIAWIKPRNWNKFILDQFPCWLLADDEKPGCYYGFPVLPETEFGAPIGLKLAHHYPAAIVDPDNVNREVTSEDEMNLRYVLDKYLPDCFESFLSYKICLYTNSPDEDFIIDKLPGYENLVTVATGFSGHGFKFASVVGEVLADLAIKGNTHLPIDFLRVGRFSSNM
jgi:sarcosine oxidase